MHQKGLSTREEEEELYKLKDNDSRKKKKLMSSPLANLVWQLNEKQRIFPQHADSVKEIVNVSCVLSWCNTGTTNTWNSQQPTPEGVWDTPVPCSLSRLASCIWLRIALSQSACYIHYLSGFGCFSGHLPDSGMKISTNHNALQGCTVPSKAEVALIILVC